ncbi:LuxR C-terminal-related transcriptional regulator [Variovorax saccharolyticus]|uniref:LuxR C-terminal-related transcriptional regulator n=1 Tax=Variovorax saccharolyticus TaxID=3053516 RepID=UPI004037F3B4
MVDGVLFGRLNKQIAADMEISERPVKEHRARVIEDGRALGGRIGEPVRRPQRRRRGDSAAPRRRCAGRLIVSAGGPAKARPHRFR